MVLITKAYNESNEIRACANQGFAHNLAQETDAAKGYALITWALLSGPRMLCRGLKIPAALDFSALAAAKRLSPILSRNRTPGWRCAPQPSQSQRAQRDRWHSLRTRTGPQLPPANRKGASGRVPPQPLPFLPQPPHGGPTRLDCTEAAAIATAQLLHLPLWCKTLHEQDAALLKPPPAVLTRATWRRRCAAERRLMAAATSGSPPHRRAAERCQVATRRRPDRGG